MRPVIRVEHLSKTYRLGEIGTGTLSHDLNRWWARLRRKEDPAILIGQKQQTGGGQPIYVHALEDVSFEVRQGEVMGIVGKNGAGKSTLLKILSRVTAPTSGHFYVRGRISSLLEVGTGFHNELTGRDNVYVNGSVLGMTRSEIRRKFDEIVAFAGMAAYIDTPVKRYSSGMMMRLAFAVAAHLDSEILIFDEVLAVGDLEFQKKCLGKMNEVSHKEGKTILYVSHILPQIRAICDTGIFLANGKSLFQGNIQDTITQYLNTVKAESVSKNNWLYQHHGYKLKVTEVEMLVDDMDTRIVFSGACVTFRMHYATLTQENIRNCSVSLTLYSENNLLCNLRTDFFDHPFQPDKSGGYIDCTIPHWPFRDQQITVSLAMNIYSDVQDVIDQVLEIESNDGYYFENQQTVNIDRKGMFYIDHHWKSN